MEKNHPYRKAGFFVIIGTLCLFGIIFNYISKKFMTDNKNLVVMYFNESIQGLSIGSSVLLQGVEIGQVNKIKLIADLKEGTFKTPVYVLFDKRKLASKQGEIFPKDHVLDNLIEKGLRARLANASILTGQLMIELIMDSEQPAKLQGTGKYREIPTVLSPFAKFSQDLQEIPLHESLIRLGDILVNLDKNLPEILKNTSNVIGKLNKMLNQQSGTLYQTLNNTNATLEEISKASRSVKNLTDYLERHPEALLHGKEK